jgi:2-methylcitrate dehydratase PrpD
MNQFSLARRVTEFTSALQPSTVPPAVWDKARRAVLHNLSVAVAGERLAQVPLRVGERQMAPTSGGARTLIQGRVVPVGQAAFINACLVHARAQDDVYFPGLTHVGAATLPAALALAEERDLSGEDLILAVVAGYEAAGALSEGIAPRTTAHGFRASGLYGVFGAAAAASRLMGLGPEATAHALAIAASFAGGTNQTWLAGTQEWQFHLGAASRSGLEAAILADAGGTGAPDALEGIAGFYQAYLHDTSEVRHLGDDLGSKWRTLDVTFKPYPVCAILQAPVTEAIALRTERPGRAIRHATLTLSPVEAAYPGTDKQGPFEDVGGALMSAAFCLAVAFTEGKVTAGDLYRHHDPEFLGIAERIAVAADPSLPPRSFRLDVEFDDGPASAGFEADDSTFNWEQDELAERVRALRGEVPPSIDLDRLIGLTEKLESHQVADLVSACIKAD